MRQNLQPLLLDHQAMDRLETATAKALKKSRPAVRELAHRQLVEALSDLLDLDLADVLIGAWRGWEELTAAAERTRRVPGLRTVVDLDRATFDVGREATVEISLDERIVQELPVRLDIELEVRALAAAVRDGCLTTISSGKCKATATLTLDGVPLPPYSVTFDLTVSLRLDPPLPLGRPEPPPPPPPRVVRLPDAAQHGRRSVP